MADGVAWLVLGCPVPCTCTKSKVNLTAAAKPAKQQGWEEEEADKINGLLWSLLSDGAGHLQAWGGCFQKEAFTALFPSSSSRYPHPNGYNSVKTCPDSVSLPQPGLAHVQNKARAVADDSNINSYSWSQATSTLGSVRNLQESGY